MVAAPGPACEAGPGFTPLSRAAYDDAMTAPAPDDQPLFNVVLTPHLGSAVMELREKMAHVVVDNIAAIVEGKEPPNCINPTVFAPGA